MSLINQTIEKLEQLQFSENTKLYKKGMFASRRWHTVLPYKREDSNIFFPASIAFLLKKNSDFLDENQRTRVQKIIDGVIGNYPHYVSLSDPFLYNFYQTKPNQHYPNGYVFSKFKHFVLADDADDTVLVTMTQGSISTLQIEEIRRQIQKFANLSQKKIIGLDEQYASLPFYTTWFGSGIMPIEIEICVLCNVLYFTFQNHCELNTQDKASINFIQLAIKNKDILNNSFTISGVYPKPCVILYHISRLCSVIKVPQEYFDTEELSEIIQSQLSKAKSTLEAAILSTSLMYLGVKPDKKVVWNLDSKELKKDFKTFSFFIAPMFSGSSNKILFFLKKYSLFHIQCTCEAFYYTLLLEYELLAKSYS